MRTLQILAIVWVLHGIAYAQDAQENPKLAAFAIEKNLPQAKVSAEYNTLARGTWPRQAEPIRFFKNNGGYAILALALPKLHDQARSEVLNTLTSLNSSDSSVIAALASALEPLMVDLARNGNSLSGEQRYGITIQRQKSVTALNRMTGVSTSGLDLEKPADLSAFVTSVRGAINE